MFFFGGGRDSTGGIKLIRLVPILDSTLKKTQKYFCKISKKCRLMPLLNFDSLINYPFFIDRISFILHLTTVKFSFLSQKFLFLNKKVSHFLYQRDPKQLSLHLGNVFINQIKTIFSPSTNEKRVTEKKWKTSCKKILQSSHRSRRHDST